MSSSFTSIILPQEIIDQILLHCDVRVAISLRNEYVKRKLLPLICIRKPEKDDGSFSKWVQRYKVGIKAEPDFGRKISCLVARNGDLIHGSFLQIDLPLLPSNNTAAGQTVAWKRHI